MPVQHNIAPPLTHVEEERLFDLISACRGEQGGQFNRNRPAQRHNRRRLFTAIDEPNRATWRAASGIYLLEKGEVITFGEAVKKHTDSAPGETPTREQMFATLEILARFRP